MCILNGFPKGLAKKDTTMFPFGLWFANANTLYVADEGNGTNAYDPSTNTYTAAATQTMAGLQKWVFNGNTWRLAYVLHEGLQLGTPYTVAATQPAIIQRLDCRGPLPPTGFAISPAASMAMVP